MTVDASKVSDAEVARLLAWYGEEKVVAMVLMLAHANFQDRLVLALGSPIEPGGPLPPLEIDFDPKADPPAVPPRKRPRDDPSPKSRRGSTIHSGSPWRSTTSRDGSRNNGRAQPDPRPVLGGSAPRAAPGDAPAREAGSDPMEPGDDGLPARVGDGLVGLHPRVPRGVEAGPGFRGKPVLDRDPHDPLLLLNGPLRNAARGRGPRQVGT